MSTNDGSFDEVAWLGVVWFFVVVWFIAGVLTRCTVHVVVVVALPFQVVLCQVPFFKNGNFEEWDLRVVSAPGAVDGVVVEEAKEADVALVDSGLNHDIEVKHILDVCHRVTVVAVMI